MKPWIGVLVSLLVVTACLVACGDSDDGPGVRNAALLTSDTAEVKVSSGEDSKGDSDYNDAVPSFNIMCVLGGDGEISSVHMTFHPLAEGGVDHQELQVRLPSLAKAPVTRLGKQALLHDTVYITSEGTAERLCDDPNQALQEESVVDRREILEALESANAKTKGGPENIPLDALLLPDKGTQSNSRWNGLLELESRSNKAPSNNDASDLVARIALVVVGREGESSNDLNARRDAILNELSLRPEPSLLGEGLNQQPTNTNLCPSRRELMRNSHPHGPYALLIQLIRLGASSGLPEICFLGHDIGSQETEGYLVNSNRSLPMPRWGTTVYCQHPHGAIYLPEGSRCRDVNLD